jgi:hypothetical protein
MLSNITDEPARGWRKHWFVKNFLVELPIIGGFFHTQNIPQMLNHAAKSTAMIVGGAVGMMSVPRSEQDSMVTEMAMQTLAMAAGMTASAVAYNGLYHAGRMVYQYKHVTTATQSEPQPPQALLETDTVRSDGNLSSSRKVEQN